MADKYIPLFLDWIEATQELKAQEKGRLIDAIVLYARGEDWSELLEGNERYVFPIYRLQIDRTREISKAKAEAGAIGGKQRVANASKTKQAQATPSYNNNNENNNENKNEEEHKGNTRARTRFTPPSLDDVQNFAKEKGYTGFNAEAFVTYYESKGWVVGRSPMKDWRAAVRGWVSRDHDYTAKAKQNTTSQTYQTRGYTDADYGDDFYIDPARENAGG